MAVNPSSAERAAREFKFLVEPVESDEAADGGDLIENDEESMALLANHRDLLLGLLTDLVGLAADHDDLGVGRTRLDDTARTRALPYDKEVSERRGGAHCRDASCQDDFLHDFLSGVIQ
jgi:hypothetical protein